MIRNIIKITKRIDKKKVRALAVDEEDKKITWNLKLSWGTFEHRVCIR